MAGPFEASDTIDHFVPADKKLADDWVRSLFARGSRTWHSSDELKTIGMPVGGICAGQVYLTGDGRLVHWDIFNSNHNTGYGQINYTAGRKPTDVVTAQGFITSPEVDQGVAIHVAPRWASGVALARRERISCDAVQWRVPHRCG